jgi:hypothetical protein
MWLVTTWGAAIILIYMTHRYDWKAATLAFIAGCLGVILKTLYVDVWEEDNEVHN